jgi:hypothetical protein
MNPFHNPADQQAQQLSARLGELAARMWVNKPKAAPVRRKLTALQSLFSYLHYGKLTVMWS